MINAKEKHNMEGVSEVWLWEESLRGYSSR